MEPIPILIEKLSRLSDTELERSDQGVTGLCGLPLAIEAFHALGLDQACRRELRLKQRDRGPTEAQWVEVLTLLHLAGGTSLEDLRIFKQDDGLCRLWKIPSQVSPRSALDFLGRFHDPRLEGSRPGKAVIVPETEGLRGLGRVNTHLVAQVQRHHPVEVATLDLDASIHPSTKREALVAAEPISVGSRRPKAEREAARREAAPKAIQRRESSRRRDKAWRPRSRPTAERPTEIGSKSTAGRTSR